MEIQQLRHFLAAADTGNLARAAAALNITQSGLSRSIKALENVVGVPLLVRTSRGVEVTDIGRSFIPRAISILNQVSRAKDELASARKSLVGHASIGVTSNFAHYVFSDVVAELAAAFPGLELSLHSGSFGKLLSRLRLSELDLVFGLMKSQPVEQDVVAEELFVARSGVYAHPSHGLASKASVALDDLVEDRWGLINDHGFLEEFSAFFRRRGLPAPRPRMTTNSFSLLRDTVIKMRLLTVLPQGFAEPSVRSGDLKMIACETPADFARVCLLYRADSPDIPIVNSTIRFLRERLLRNALTSHSPAQVSRAP